MDTLNEIFRSLGEIRQVVGHIQGEMMEIRKLSDRVRRLEVWQSWLKGGWTALAGAYVYLRRQAFGR